MAAKCWRGENTKSESTHRGHEGTTKNTQA
jgi:hypothetical protein